MTRTRVLRHALGVLAFMPLLGAVYLVDVAPDGLWKLLSFAAVGVGFVITDELDDALEKWYARKKREAYWPALRRIV